MNIFSTSNFLFIRMSITFKFIENLFKIKIFVKKNKENKTNYKRDLNYTNIHQVIGMDFGHWKLW